MARKIIALKEPTIIALQFNDGKEVEAVFNMKSLRVLSEEFGNVVEVMQRASSDPYTAVTQLLYAAIKAMGEGLPYDEVETIVALMDFNSLSEILATCTEGLDSIASNADLKKKRRLC